MPLSELEFIRVQISTNHQSKSNFKFGELCEIPLPYYSKFISMHVGHRSADQNILSTGSERLWEWFSEGWRIDHSRKFTRMYPGTRKFTQTLNGLWIVQSFWFCLFLFPSSSPMTTL